MATRPITPVLTSIAACNASWTANSQEEIVRLVAEHLQAQHNVKTISKTLANFVTTAVRRT